MQMYGSFIHHTRHYSTKFVRILSYWTFFVYKIIHKRVIWKKFRHLCISGQDIDDLSNCYECGIHTLQEKLSQDCPVNLRLIYNILHYSYYVLGLLRSCLCLFIMLRSEQRYWFLPGMADRPSQPIWNFFRFDRGYLFEGIHNQSASMWQSGSRTKK